MSRKRKDKEKRGLTDFIRKDSKTEFYEIRDIVRWYTRYCSSVIPTEEQEMTMRKMYALDPELMGVIVTAFREHGYESF